jgi:hypothetical protein
MAASGVRSGAGGQRAGGQRAGGQRAGYVIAIIVDAMLIYVVGNLLEWDVLPFLTSDFERVSSAIVTSLVAGIVVNAIWLLHDPRWLRSLGQIVILVVGLVALARLWQVFPFDFSSYGFDWGVVARIMLAVAIVGSGLGILGEVVKLAGRSGDQAGDGIGDDAPVA